MPYMSARKHRIFFLLQRASHCLKKEADRCLMEHGGLTVAQSAVLSIISDTGQVTQKEIAQQLQLNESAMTAMIARLLKGGLITRVQDSSDARTRQIGLTSAGKTALAKVQQPFSEINATLDATLGKKRAADFARDLNAVIEAFQIE